MASAVSHIVYRTGWLASQLHHVGSLYILTYDARKLKHKINLRKLIVNSLRSSYFDVKHSSWLSNFKCILKIIRNNI